MKHGIIYIAFIQIHSRTFFSGSRIIDKHAVPNRRTAIGCIHGRTGRTLACRIGRISTDKSKALYAYRSQRPVFPGRIHRLVYINEVFRIVSISSDISRVQYRITQIIHSDIGPRDVVGISAPQCQTLGRVFQISHIGFLQNERITACPVLQERHIVARSNLDIFIFFIGTEQQYLNSLMNVRRSPFPRFSVVFFIRNCFGTLHIQYITAERSQRYRFIFISPYIDRPLFPLFHIDHIYTVFLNNVICIGFFGNTPFTVQRIRHILASRHFLHGIISFAGTIEYDRFRCNCRTLHRAVGIHFDNRIQSTCTAIRTPVNQRRERRQREIGRSEIISRSGIIAGKSEPRPHNRFISSIQKGLEISCIFIDIGCRSNNFPMICIDTFGIVIPPDNRIGKIITGCRSRINGTTRCYIARHILGMGITHDRIVD